VFFKSKLFIVIIFSLFTAAIFLQIKKNLFNDISVEPISTLALSSNNQSVHDPVYLVTYADGPQVFFQNQNILGVSALNKGVDYIHNYRRSLLDPAFVNQHQSVLNQKRGAGYWLWKPYIIAKTLALVPENAIIIYADSGCIFNNPITPLLNYLKNHDMIFMQWDKGFHLKNEQIAKRDLLIAMDCDTLECRKSMHIWAAFMVLRNTPRTRAFIAKWFENCCIEKNITDTLSEHKEYDDYDYHHHDEAILSLSYFKDPANIKIISGQEFKLYMTWHHRHPHLDRFSVQDTMKKNP